MYLELDKKEYKIVVDYLSRIINEFEKVDLIDGILLKVVTVESDQKYISNDTVLFRLSILYSDYSQSVSADLFSKVQKLIEGLYKKTEIELHVTEYFYDSFNDFTFLKHPEYIEVLRDSEILLDKHGVLRYLITQLPSENILCMEQAITTKPPLNLK